VRALLVLGMMAVTARVAWGQTAASPPSASPPVPAATPTVEAAPPPRFRLALQLGFGALTQLDAIGSAHNQGDLVGELSLRAPNASGWQPHLRLLWGSLVPAGLPPVGIRVVTLGATRRWETFSGSGWLVPYLGGGVGLYSTPFARRAALSADAGVDLPLRRWLSLVANASFTLVFSGQTRPMLGTLTIGAQLSTS
jgi:hypothetical protein